MAAIQEKISRIRWERNPATVKEAFSMACFPPEELALAARESDRKVLPANLVLISGGVIKKFMPVRLELFSEQVQPDCLEISGQMLDMPGGIDFSAALMILNNRESEELQWDSNTGYLFARFRGAGKITGKTPIAILFEII